MDVMPDREEQFRQFEAAHLERQTDAMERTMRHVGAIRGMITVWLILTIVAALVITVISTQG